MRTGPATDRLTREYQHTNRRVTNITPHPSFTSCRFQLLLIDEQIEKELPLPVDNISAISTVQGERREAAAADGQFVSDPTGCLLFAPPCRLALVTTARIGFRSLGLKVMLRPGSSLSSRAAPQVRNTVQSVEAVSVME